MRVRLRGAMVLDDHDRWSLFRSTNDLFVATEYAFGEKPIVDRVHYVGAEDELGWYGEFSDDVVVSKRDLRDERFHLRVKIYDLKGVPSEIKTEMGKLATTPAGAFPLLAPYSGDVGREADRLVSVVNDIERHGPILDRRLTLEMAEPETGRRLLQPGYYVCTKNGVRNRDLSLDDDLRMVEGVDGSAVEYTDASYAVVQIDKNVANRRRMEIDRRVAALIAQLNGKGRSSETDLHHLRETLEAYTVLSRLERVRELQSRSDLTAAEESLLAELGDRNELQRYLELARAGRPVAEETVR